MRKIILDVVLCIVLAGLAGCATTSPYGNFVTHPAVGLNQQQIARDSVQKLLTLYPPAKTQFELSQPTPDPFGQALVNNLRAKGYALFEGGLQAKTAQQNMPDNESSDETDNPRASSHSLSLPLAYVVDQAIDMNLYRVTVLVGHQSFSRPYVQQDGTTAPVGYWVHKE